MGDRFKSTKLHAVDQTVTEGDVRKAARRVGLQVEFKAAERNGTRRVELKDDRRFVDTVSYNMNEKNALKAVREKVVAIGNSHRGMPGAGAALAALHA